MIRIFFPLGAGSAGISWIGRGASLLAQGPIPCDHDGAIGATACKTIARSMAQVNGDYRQWRVIADLGNLARSLAVLPTGQSGSPASPHYDDLTPLWLNGEYHPLLMDRDEIDAVAEGTLVLNPAPQAHDR